MYFYEPLILVLIYSILLLPVKLGPNTAPLQISESSQQGRAVLFLSPSQWYHSMMMCFFRVCSSLSVCLVSVSEQLTIQVRTSHSHESLCPSPPPSGLHSIDLSSKDVFVRALHFTVLEHGHCFQVATGNGSKYYYCRTDDDRQTWLK